MYKAMKEHMAKIWVSRDQIRIQLEFIQTKYIEQIRVIALAQTLASQNKEDVAILQ